MPGVPPITQIPSTLQPDVRVGFSANPDPSTATRELRALIGQDDVALMLAFASNVYDREALANHLHREFGSLSMIGCTTAGEIGPDGYMEGGLSGLTLGHGDVVHEVGLIENVSQLDTREGQAFAYNLRQKLAQKMEHFDPNRCFALLLIDGLCGREEYVARAINDGLGGIQMVGGSAGDGLHFNETAVLYNGRFHTDAAVLVVAATPYPFTTFKTQNFVAGSRRLVLTSAIPEQRIAREINGFPAAEEYARVVGLNPGQLSPLVFSEHPVVVKIGGADFVRSIQRVNSDGSMTFFCAIDEGIVFNVADSVDFVDNLKALFYEIEQRIGQPRIVIGCDCMLRRLEVSHSGKMNDVSSILREHRVIGFSSYGEQFRGMHVNQTFTGIAFGARKVAA